MESTTQHLPISILALSASYAIHAAEDQEQIERILIDTITQIDDQEARILHWDGRCWYDSSGEFATKNSYLAMIAGNGSPFQTKLPATPPLPGFYTPLARDTILFIPEGLGPNTDGHEGIAHMLAENAALAIARLGSAHMPPSQQKASPALAETVDQRYQVLFEHTVNAVMLSDDAGMILQANKAAGELFGYPHEQIQHLYSPDLLGISAEKLRVGLADYPTQGYTFGTSKVRHRNGEWRTVEYVICRIDNNLHISILHHISDQITPSKLPQQRSSSEAPINQPTHQIARWSNSEERYRMLIDTSPSAILITTAEGIISFCSSQAAVLFGYEPIETMYGINISALIDEGPTSGKQILADIQQSRNIEYIMRRRDGGRFYADVSSSSIPLAEGRAPSVIIVVHDISIRKQAERLLTAAYNDVASRNRYLNHTQRLLQDLFNGLEDGLLLLNKDGQVQSINRTLANLIGIAPEQALDRPWADVYRQAAPSFPGHLALEANEIGRHRSQHNRYTAPDGITRILDIRVTAIGHTRNVSHIIMHVIDETDTVRLQEQIIRTEHFAASGRLAASVAHEINTPLQTIQTNLKLLQRTVTQDNQTFLDDALEEIRRLGRIVRQLLDFYRPTTMTVAQVDIAALIDRLMLMLGKNIRDQHVIVERQIDADLPFIYGRADEITQILINLFINALDAMPQGGRLTICVEVAPSDRIDGPEQMMIAISDSGPGLPESMRDQIFEPFITTKEHGTGLGLWISRQLVEQSGGTIWAANNPDHGCTFSIALPISAALARSGGL